MISFGGRWSIIWQWFPFIASISPPPAIVEGIVGAGSHVDDAVGQINGSHQELEVQSLQELNSWRDCASSEYEGVARLGTKKTIKKEARKRRAENRSKDAVPKTTAGNTVGAANYKHL